MYPSTKAKNPKDARYGNGQYFTDIKPGEKSNAQLSKSFINTPYQGQKFSHHVGVNVDGLHVKKPADPKRKNVYVVPNENDLDLKERITSSGKNP